MHCMMIVTPSCRMHSAMYEVFYFIMLRDDIFLLVVFLYLGLSYYNLLCYNSLCAFGVIMRSCVLALMFTHEINIKPRSRVILILGGSE